MNPNLVILSDPFSITIDYTKALDDLIREAGLETEQSYRQYRELFVARFVRHVAKRQRKTETFRFRALSFTDWVTYVEATAEIERRRLRHAHLHELATCFKKAADRSLFQNLSAAGNMPTEPHDGCRIFASTFVSPTRKILSLCSDWDENSKEEWKYLVAEQAA